MRIVQIGPFPVDRSLIRGGVESSVYGLAQEQAKTSSVFVIDVPRLDIKDSVEEYERLTVYRFRNPGPHQKDSKRRVKSIIKVISGIRPEICHIHGTGEFSRAVWIALKEAGFPLMLTVHGLVGVEKKKALKQHFSWKLLYQYIIQRKCERELLSAQRTIIVDTEYVAEAIKNYHLSRTPRMAIIPQGINEHFYEINGSSSSRTILSVGSISKRKGHHLLIQSFSKAAERLKDIKLVICGAMADRSYYQSLQKLATDSHCQERISLQADLPKEEVFEQFSNAHVFALHTQEESQGIVFAEAMATGLPIVSTRVGGVPFVVSEGENGFLTEYGDVSGFARALVEVMSLGDYWYEISSKSKKASKEYSWTSIAEKVSVEYLKIQ
jgi:glycosyltransferase involved in cell wall biosynthesis